jgi:solute carrier family 25 carnitine/acylcarnitine transporter 20/29
MAATESSWKRSAKDFTSGVVAGVAQVLVGHPANTLKSRLQMQPTPPIYNGAAHCFTVMLREEGYRGFYRGMASPIVGVGFVNAVVFFCNEETKRLIVTARGYSSVGQLNLADSFVAGGLTGLAASAVTCPVELPMVRLQTEKILHPERTTSGPVAMARQMVAERGIRALYSGMLPTMHRETWSYATYFAVYYQSRQWLAIGVGGGGEEADGSGGKKKEGEISALNAFLAGGASGQCGQLVALPIDAMKVRLQTDDMKAPKYRGMMHAARIIYKADGLGGFYRGLVPVVLRAFPVNGATFVAFEATMKLLDGL